MDIEQAQLYEGKKWVNVSLITMVGMQDAIDALAAEVRRLREENERLKDCLRGDNPSDLTAHYKEKWESVEAECESLKKELAWMKHELKDAEDGERVAEAKCGGLALRIEQYVMLLDESEAKVAELKEENAQLSKWWVEDMQTAKQQIEEFEAKVAAMEGCIAALENCSKLGICDCCVTAMNALREYREGRTG